MTESTSTVKFGVAYRVIDHPSREHVINVLTGIFQAYLMVMLQYDEVDLRSSNVAVSGPIHTTEFTLKLTPCREERYAEYALNSMFNFIRTCLNYPDEAFLGRMFVSKIKSVIKYLDCSKIHRAW